MDSIAAACGTNARMARVEPMTPSRIRVIGSIGFAAAVAHASNSPDEWPRTVEGLAIRIADRSGVVAMQELTHRGISRYLSWQPTAAPCPTGVLARTRCAVARTLIVRNAAGAPRPDLARIASLALGSAASLLWRPERGARSDAAALVLTRVGSGLAFATLRHVVAGGKRSASHAHP